MTNNFEFYRKYIKPIEKKYNIMCTLYSIFKIKLFKNKRDKYNIIINNYYQFILSNKKALKELEKYFNN